MRRGFHFALMISVLLILLSGCRDRYFRNEATAVAHLREHLQDFQGIAEGWAAKGPDQADTFCNFSPGNYRWGQTFIRKNSSGFLVEKDREKGDAASLEESAKRANVAYSTLSRWVDLTTKNKIYCIEDDGSEKIVQILLEGSDWSPYGFRYALPTSPSAMDTLRHSVKMGKLENTDTKMKYAFGRWFYFEAKR